MAQADNPIPFPEIDDAQIAALSRFATLRSFRAGETLFAASDSDFKFFVVKRGEVEITERSSGHDKRVAVHGPRQFTGDVDMLTGQPTIVTAVRSKIENYMGFPTGLSGSDLASRAVIQAQKFGALISAPAEVLRLSCEHAYHGLALEGGEEITARCIVIAAGASYRKLDVEGCERFEGSGVCYAATAMEAQLCRDARVVIIGGGNSAGQAAIHLSEHSASVILIIRGDDLSKGMSQYLTRRIEQTSNITVRHNTELSAMRGDKSLSEVELTCNHDGKHESIECQAVFVFIGAVPHTTWLPDGIQRDEKGFIKTGSQLVATDAWPLNRPPFLLETSRPGIFAAGDVRLGSTKRVASAVGEGAMAVQFAHEYLATA